MRASYQPLRAAADRPIALLAAKGCPLGVFQRRADDDVPMFELWFGPRFAPVAIPALTAAALAGGALVLARPPPACGPVGVSLRATPYRRENGWWCRP